MDLLEAIQARHSVRRYKDKAIEKEVRQQLRQTAETCNQESGLNIQLCFDEPQAFGGNIARYGNFRNVKNA